MHRLGTPTSDHQAQFHTGLESEIGTQIQHSAISSKCEKVKKMGGTALQDGFDPPCTPASVCSHHSGPSFAATTQPFHSPSLGSCFGTYCSLNDASAEQVYPAPLAPADQNHLVPWFANLVLQLWRHPRAASRCIMHTCMTMYYPTMQMNDQCQTCGTGCHTGSSKPLCSSRPANHFSPPATHMPIPSQPL